MLSALSGWVDQNSDKLTDYTEFDRSGKIFTGTQMIASLDMLGIGNDKIGDLKVCLCSGFCVCIILFFLYYVCCL